jgi:MraZ protein
LIGYIGKYVVSLDDNGRLAIPARLRKARPIGVSPKKQIKGYVLAIWMDSCLGLFTEDEWVRLLMEVQTEGSRFRKENRVVNRHLSSNAYPVTPDSQGRITIPKELIKETGLGSNVLVMGATTHIEIWDQERLKQFTTENKVSESAEQLFEKK